MRKNRVKKNRVKKNKDYRTVSLNLPEEVYLSVKIAAKEEIRSVAQQARYYMEIGMQVVAQQMEMEINQDDDGSDDSPAIGFVVDNPDDEEYEDDE